VAFRPGPGRYIGAGQGFEDRGFASLFQPNDSQFHDSSSSIAAGAY
jgi:hypothetical protein